MADFRPCSICPSYSQANLYHYALQLILNQPEFTFAHLRYTLEGARPRQTTHHTLYFNKNKVRINFRQEEYFTDISAHT